MLLAIPGKKADGNCAKARRTLQGSSEKRRLTFPPEIPELAPTLIGRALRAVLQLPKARTAKEHIQPPGRSRVCRVPPV